MLFLTGLPRSGTTWAARALHASLGGELISEPCNWVGRPERKQWHMRYLPGSMADVGFDAVVHETLRPDRQTIVKEVHTCLAIERWAEAHDHIAIVVRHPGALAASWHRLGYTIDFRLQVLLDQPCLLEDHLATHEDHLRDQSSWFSQVGAYWGASYFVLARIADHHPSWRWVSHQALCDNPVQRLGELAPGLPLDMVALEAFLAANDAAPPEGASPYETVRQTAREAERWRGDLSGDQLAEVMAGAAPFDVDGLLARGS